MPTPSLSVVVPMYNAPENLERCLAGLDASTLKDFELILVDDCSTDERAIALARASGARYHRMPENGGPGIARNAGVELARGEVIVFIDSDVVVHPDTLERIQSALAADPGAAALFGSYDDQPASPGLVTEYRNLLHHWVHQTGPPEASTFWAGCGAIRRAAFLEVGGFDPAYRRPSIEDIELGMRLRQAGHRILLRPEIQCTHLKRWRFWEMIRVDVTCRAIPWTRLLIERPSLGGNLNVESGQKLCVVLVFAALALPLALAVLAPGWLAGPAALLPLLLLLPVVVINRGLYALFWRRKGPLFTLAAFGLHLLYFLYSGLAFAWAQLLHRLGLSRTAVPDSPRVDRQS